MLKRISNNRLMNKLTTAKRVAVLKALVEGVSVRATVRLTGVSKGAVLRLLMEVGEACASYMDTTFRNLKCRRIQCDEIWSFVGAKERAIKRDPTIKERNPNAGDIWTWVAIDADSKLVLSFVVGGRTASMAHQLMDDVASRLAHRVQLTTDGLHAYLNAVEDAFLGDIDYAQLIKIFTETGHSGRYSPAECIGTKAEIIQGDPDPSHINTSYVERQNLTVRMNNRRFTRLTNAFSKKAENHMASLALFYMHYNFCRVHQTLRVTPAMEAGITATVWSIEDIVALTSNRSIAA